MEVERERGLCSRLAAPVGLAWATATACGGTAASPDAPLVLGLPVDELPTAVDAELEVEVEGLMRGMGAKRCDRRLAAVKLEPPGRTSSDAGAGRPLVTNVRTCNGREAGWGMGRGCRVGVHHHHTTK
jgi:hypothetical protein